MLKTALRSFFQIPGAPRSGDTLVVALSSGPDSTALLHGLVELQPETGVDLHVAHFNHALRGADSDNDQTFARELARSLEIPFTTGDDPGGPHHEAGLRERRYAFLSMVRRETGARWIATGHTASDQAETLLMNLLRGAGPRGLGGMLPLGPRDVCRPLLRVPREEVLAYLTAGGFPYREDASNLNEGPTRNRIRRRLLPLLAERFTSQAPRILAREAELFASLDDYLRGESDRVLASCLVEEAEGLLVLDTPLLSGHHPALVREVLRRGLERLTGAPGATWDHLERVWECAQTPEGTVNIQLPGHVTVSREYRRLRLTVDSPPAEPAPDPVLVDLGAGGVTCWGGYRLQWDILGAARAPGRETAAAVTLDLEGIQGSLRLRAVLPGDRIEPKGMDGSQKVSRMLINRKVPRRMRQRVPVLCDNGGPHGRERVLWVVGHRRSRHACIRPETSRVAIFEAETD